MPAHIPDSTIQWLLEPDNPPVRYLTMTRLLGRNATDPEVVQAKEQSAGYGPTQAILADFAKYRNDKGARAYWKYEGKYWQIIFLGQFLADGQDPQIRELADEMISTEDWVLIPSGGQCLTSNLLSALNLLGYSGHPRVQEATVKLAERLVRDGGIDCSVMEYSLLPFCYMAQPKLLFCFASSGALRQHPTVAAAIELLSANLLAHQISQYVTGNLKGWLEVLEKAPAKSELGGRTVKSWLHEQKERFLAEKGLGDPSDKPSWLKFGFPLHYNSDLLEAAYALALCDLPFVPALEKPLRVIREKMTAEGKLRLENTLNGKMRVDVEVKGKPSKWLTYRAWYVLNHFSACFGNRLHGGL